MSAHTALVSGCTIVYELLLKGPATYSNRLIRHQLVVPPNRPPPAVGAPRIDELRLKPSSCRLTASAWPSRRSASA